MSCPKCGAKETSALGSHKWYACSSADVEGYSESSDCIRAQRDLLLARVQQLESENKSLYAVLEVAGIDSGDVQNYLNDLALENMGTQKFDGSFAPRSKT